MILHHLNVLEIQSFGPVTTIFSSTRDVGPLCGVAHQGGFRTRIGGSEPINRPVHRIATPKRSSLLRRLLPHPRDPTRPAFQRRESQTPCAPLPGPQSVQREASSGPGGHAAQMTPAATEFPYLYETS